MMLCTEAKGRCPRGGAGDDRMTGGKATTNCSAEKVMMLCTEAKGTMSYAVVLAMTG